jgi:hypothetical protein
VLFLCRLREPYPGYAALQAGGDKKVNAAVCSILQVSLHCAQR